MRLLEITIPDGQRGLVVAVLEREGLDYYVTDETSGRQGEYDGIVTVPLPENAVQPVLDELRRAGLHEDAHRIVVNAEVDTSRRFEDLTRRYAAERGRRVRISREEIRIRARELSPSIWTFVALTVISAVVATAGLLLDSPAVVVGSMVIAPLVGPALSASIGTILDDPALFRRGVRLQVLGVGLAVVSAAAFAQFIRLVPLFPPRTNVLTIPEIVGRVSPDFLSLIIAFGAGIAGIISLSVGVSSALVGVMIAVALIPPAATVGIGVAWGEPFVAVNAGVLVLVNLLAINLTALVTLRYLGYRPKRWLQPEESRGSATRRITLLFVALAVLSVFLAGVTFSSVQDAEFTRSVRLTTDSVLDQQRYEGAERLDVDVRFRSAFPVPFDAPESSVPSRRPGNVVITIGVPAGESYPDLAERLHARIQEATGEQVGVQVQYVETDSVNVDSAAETRLSREESYHRGGRHEGLRREESRYAAA